MSTSWNRARIRFQYSPLGKPNHRAIDQMTLMVYGKSESAAIQALRKTYATTRQDFVILELNWQN
jgi:hypothetical protein